MNWKIITVLVLSIGLLIGSQFLRAQSAKENCTNVERLRDAMDGVITLADELTPPNPESDKFYRRAHNELGRVQC